MMLFSVGYMDDCEVEHYLTIGENAKEVEKREREKLWKMGCCLMGSVNARAITEIDGYNIILIKK